jgi:hypothetical protein
MNSIKNQDPLLLLYKPKSPYDVVSESHVLSTICTYMRGLNTLNTLLLKDFLFNPELHWSLPTKHRLRVVTKLGGGITALINNVAILLHLLKFIINLI